MQTRSCIDEYAVKVTPVEPEFGGGYQAFFPQLARGVVGYGATREAAMADLGDAIPAFLEAVSETGQSLPEPAAPRDWDEFSGKFNVRVPKVLHATLVRIADEQGVSLNSLVQTVLASGAATLEAGHEFGAVSARTDASGSTYQWADRVADSGAPARNRRQSGRSQDDRDT